MSELSDTVKDMLRKGRSEESILQGLKKLGYSEEDISEAIKNGRKALQQDEPGGLLEVGKFFKKQDERFELKTDTLLAQDSERPLKDNEQGSSGWIFPVIALIVILWLVVALIAAFGEQIGLKDAAGQALKIIQNQKPDSEFYTYCMQNLEGYSQKDAESMCSYLDNRPDPRNLRYADMTEACRKLSFDVKIVNPCALDLTRIVDEFNARAKHSQN